MTPDLHNELKLATSDLANFLQDKLPELSDQWWEKHIVERLSFQQQRVVGEKKLSSLRDLDFAALLRILDQNWYDLSEEITLPREARNWVKEIQTVRNKWAHKAAEETPASEIYRDADTLGRLLALIGTNEKSVNAVQAAKDARLIRVTGKLQREGIVTHVIADHLEDMTYRLHALGGPDFEPATRRKNADGAYENNGAYKRKLT